MRLLLALLLCGALAHAQSSGTVRAVEARPVYGAVSGTVTCADTTLPARLARVSLQPVHDPQSEAARPARSSAPLTTISTDLYGRYTFPHVRTGSYYVVVQKPGYLSPVTEFSRDQIEKASTETLKELAQELPVVTVLPNSQVTQDVQLHRGGSVSGTIRYDDGTAASEQQVQFERRNAQGQWSDIEVSGYPRSDDTGRFHVGGLPAGEYRLSTTMVQQELQSSHLFGGPDGYSSRPLYSLVVYFPGSFRADGAKPFKLAEGEDVSVDMTIPVAKLHSLSGSLVEARSGRVINAGTIAIFTADSNVKIAETRVNPDEPLFNFSFLPEGEYTVRVSDAREVIREENVLPPGTIGTRSFKETVLKKFAPYEAPLIVQSDRTGVTLPIPALKAE